MLFNAVKIVEIVEKDYDRLYLYKLSASKNQLF